MARHHLATNGANLSLRAVARDLGMVSSALYRYFASRDELLTALILDGYNAMGEAAEAADAAVADQDRVVDRWRAVTGALRGWALARPAEYALLYGSPVPGYAAPSDTVGPASRPVVVLGRILSHAAAVGALTQPPHTPPEGPHTPPEGPAGAPTDARPDTSADASAALPPALLADVRRIADLVAPEVSEIVMARGLLAWTQLFGAISFELFGRLDNAIGARDEWFDHQMRVLADFIGLRRT